MTTEEQSDLNKLSEEHKKIKNAISEMCDHLDSESDVDKKEIIKKAIDASFLKLEQVEEACSNLLDKIEKKYARN